MSFNLSPKLFLEKGGSKILPHLQMNVANCVAGCGHVASRANSECLCAASMMSVAGVPVSPARLPDDPQIIQLKSLLPLHRRGEGLVLASEVMAMGNESASSGRSRGKPERAGRSREKKTKQTQMKNCLQYVVADLAHVAG